MNSDLLNDLLQQYNMPHAKAELIRHNENMTYCIEEKYLLRIHQPKPGFNTAHFNKEIDIVNMHENELRFLMQLDAAGLYVQKPICNMNGKLVTVHQSGIAATMLTWLPGRILTKEDISGQCGIELGAEIGRLLCRMHQAAKGFQAGDVIMYDQLLCIKLISLLSTYYKNGSLKQEHFGSMTRALELIGDQLKQTEAEHICLHSDLSLSNILMTKQGLVPIDFSLFGYSDPLLDFGSIYCFVNDEACRKSIVTGYEEEMGTQISVSKIKYYFAFQILLGIILHYELWVNEEWFAKRLPEWCRDNFDVLNT